ncbi:MAG: DUF3189 family protein [Tepidanaerobacteraceae bacterium]|nr:DUF3189 family protein [Tepidanaerobacteraceae bacterium]
MKVIYSCYWGSYLAAVAASLHLGIINDAELSMEKMLNLPMFGKIKNEDFGEMKFIGFDGRNRGVFIIGAKRSGRIIERALNGFAQIYGMEKKTVKFIDLTVYNNFYIGTGVFLIRMLGLRRMGMKILFCGIKKSFAKIKELVGKIMNEPDYFQENVELL